MIQYCTFWTGGHLYGVDIRFVKEINGETAFTPLPHASPKIRGYVNIRGQIHLILDLRTILGYEGAAGGADAKLVLFKPAVGEAFGVLVDKVEDIVTAEDGQIEPKLEAADEKGVAAVAVATCVLADRIVTVIDPHALLGQVGNVKNAGESHNFIN